MIMKMRKGWNVIWPDGTVWFGDCPVWMERSRKAGWKIVPIRILGPRRWPCNEPSCHHYSA